MIVEAELAAVADHDGLAPHNRFFAGSTGDGAVDRCGAAQLPVGLPASQVGPGDRCHGFSASAALRGQPLWPRGCFGLPCASNAVCESEPFSGRS